MLFSSVIKISLVITATLGFSACSRTEEGTRERTREAGPDAAAGIAHVRYVNALTSNAGAELYFGDSRLFAGSQRETGYIQVPAERRDFELRHAGKAPTEPLATNSEGLRRDAHYTVIAFDDENGKATLRVVNDEESAPSSGKAKVRVIDAAAREGDFDLYVAGRRDNKLAGEPALGAVSGWKEVDAVQEPLELRMRDGRASRVPIPDVRLQAGRLYTFVVTDARTAGQPPQVITLENEPTRLPIAPTVPPTVPPGL